MSEDTNDADAVFPRSMALIRQETSLHTRLSVPIPRRLRTRPLDTRGYPVPWVVLIDKTGTPQFTINDAERVAVCRTKHLCGLCGKRFENGMWFIGGQRCFTEEHGAFVDPPNHYECAEYALRVCPFLAVPNYNKRIDTKKMSAAGYGSGKDTIAILTHNGMPEAQPERFGLGCTRGYTHIPQAQVFVPDPWRYVEYWRNGVTVSAPEIGGGG